MHSKPWHYEVVSRQLCFKGESLPEPSGEGFMSHRASLDMVVKKKITTRNR
jgi:hypothetical protein